MVQQTFDSKFSEFRQSNSETGFPKYDKQVPVPLVAAKKTALGDLQNESRNMVPKSVGSSVVKENGPTIEDVKVSGTKRPQPENQVRSSQQTPTSNNGPLVYVRRKAESEHHKGSTFNKSNDQPRKLCEQDEKIQEQLKDSTICSPKDVPELRIPSEAVSSAAPLVPPNSGKSNITSPVADSSCPQPDNPKRLNSQQCEELCEQDEKIQEQVKDSTICSPKDVPEPKIPSEAVSSAAPLVPPDSGKSNITSPVADSNCPQPDNSKRLNSPQWEERFYRLQNFLKVLDQSNQDDYHQRLRSLSSVDLSRLAVELEKRSIQLSLEEAREVQRARLMDFMYENPRNLGEYQSKK